MRKVLLVLLVAVAALLGFAATRPDSFRVERAIDIHAPPEKVHALLNDFRQWTRWSPWEGLDPAMQRSYSGAASGPGAVYAWQGNKEVGRGRMEIRADEPARRLSIQLDFLEPFEGHNTAEFTLTPTQGGTHVVWAMFGPAPFLSELIGVFVSMDRMIRGDFETGLAQLKRAAES